MRKITTIIAAMALSGAALNSLPAIAAPTPASQLSTGDAQALCKELDNQFKFVIQFKDGLPYTQDARKLHKSGMTECDGGQPVQGVADLQKSIRGMYVVPDTL
ncbi:MAG: hypothetical protein CVT73_00790 [Alphaproteobacteria bacterium HGW-Alphaproteobacteria-12]|nr:MAG: hypothetical protein CVT73_00790 [Alphaproteobacteria bacterium HGW-Alphaproteobacteria-12]